jgi:hypothetical protein
MAQNDLLDASPLPRSPAAALPYLDEVVIGDTTKLLATLPDQSIHMIASERERIMRLSRDAAIKQLMEGSKLASRQSQIEKVADTGLLEAISG